MPAPALAFAPDLLLRAQGPALGMKVALFDVDGVLTDGRLLYTERGDEIKAFHVQDGSSIKLLLEYGIQVALFTGRRSDMVTRRAAELGIEHVFQGVADKALALEQADKIRLEIIQQLTADGFKLSDLSKKLSVTP